jgi:hypothetical protein
MRIAAILSSISVVLSLDLILFLGAVVPDMHAIRALVDGLVVFLDLTLVVSSILLALRFSRKGRRPLAVVFSLNIAMLAVAYGLGSMGFRFPSPVLYAADIYWLNLYIASLASDSAGLFSTAS